MRSAELKPSSLMCETRPGEQREKPQGKTKMLLAISITIGVILFVTLVFLNLRASEKQIRYELPHRFAVSDPRFVRNMNHLLGPGILEGNRITSPSTVGME